MATKTKHNSPDPTKYHDAGHMAGTMIPLSDKDGNPVGFDPNKPQKVIVDPEYKDSVELDMSRLAGMKSKFNAAASKLREEEDFSEFYRKFSAEPEQEQEAKVPEEIEELQPIEIQSLEHEENKIATDMQVNLADAEKLFGLLETKREEVTSGYQDLGPSFAALLSQLNQQGAAIKALLAKNSTPIEPKKKEDSVLLPNEVCNKVETNIDFLTDKPQRPQFEAYFEMEKMGTMAARYHAVVPGQDCLALIYDTRFEDGFQYLPPNLGQEKITVSVPKLSNSSYTCSSLGLHWTLGCLDVVILIKHGE